MNLCSKVEWISRNFLLEIGAISEVWVKVTGFKPTSSYFENEESTISANKPDDWTAFWVLIYTMQLTEYCYHVTYSFRLRLQPLVARMSRNFVLKTGATLRLQRQQRPGTFSSKRAASYLPKLLKSFSCVVSTYLYDTFDCILLSCYLRVSESVYTV